MRGRSRSLVSQAEDKRQEGDRERDHDEPGQHHPSGDVGSGERLMGEDDQIRQVRAGEEERRAVRDEERAIEERALVALTPARRVEDDRRHEDGSGVEIEHRCDDRLEPEHAGEERDGAARQTLEARTDSSEQTVSLDDGADQQQTRDEHERRPRL